MKRGAVTKKEARLITVWLPLVLIPYIDLAVVRNDTDRAKYIRQAIREKLSREGVAQ
jgi:metal-responsive CopG/Arc/MetJ family transcriptional regulator